MTPRSTPGGRRCSPGRRHDRPPTPGPRLALLWPCVMIATCKVSITNRMRPVQVQRSLLILIGLHFAMTGCGHSSYEIARMNTEEIKLTSDVDICFANQNQFVEKTPAMVTEVQRRRLNCTNVLAADRAKFANTPQTTSSQASTAGASVAQTTSSQASAADRSAATTVRQGPISCGGTRLTNLTGDEGKALKFLFEQKYALKSVGCIVEIIALEKFPLRGNTVIKYSAKVQFPAGYKTQCFNVQQGFGWNEYQTQALGGCNPFGEYFDPIGQPARPGEVRVFAGEDVI
jgi:hypothetical protein